MAARTVQTHLFLYHALQPCLRTLRFFGLFFDSLGLEGNKGKLKALSLKEGNETGWRVYSIIVIIMVWLNFLGHFCVFFMPLSVSKLYLEENPLEKPNSMRVWVTITALLFFSGSTALTFHWNSRHGIYLKQLFDTWENLYDGNDSMGSLLPKMFVRAQHVLLTIEFSTIVLSVFVELVFFYQDSHIKMNLLHLIWSIGNNVTLILALGIMSTGYLFYFLMCWAVSFRFNDLNSEIKLNVFSGNSGHSVLFNEYFRRFEHLCELVRSCDRIFRPFISVSFVVYLPMLSFFIYKALWSSVNLTNKSISYGLTIMSLLGLYSLCFAASRVTASLIAWFQRLQGTSIGLTCGSFFVITTGTMLNMTGLLITYFAIMVQFHQPYS